MKMTIAHLCTNALPDQGVYPRYAFGLDWRSLPAMKDVISTFAATDPMCLAAWFENTSSFLGERRLREVIPEDCARVLEAVQDPRLQQGS